MKLIFTLTIFIVFIISCKNSNSFESNSSSAQNDSRESLNIQIKNFTEIDSSGVFIFPLQMSENKSRTHRSIYNDVPYNSNWNLIFYNSKSKEYHLLSDKKMLIENFVLSIEENSKRSSKWVNDFIFYEIRVNDFNKDNLLNETDPVYLFISDRFGENFHQISPENYNVNRWELISNSDKIILSASNDNNQNKEFDNEDEVSIFEVDLKSNEKPREIFMDDFKKELKNIYLKYWNE